MQAPKANAEAPKLKIDSSGEFPSGETYSGFDDFKKILMRTRSELFSLHLTSMILTHSTGRHMEALDQFEIEEILSRVNARNGGLRTLVVESIASEIFRSR